MQTDTSVVKLNTSLIVPNKYQPRKVFDEKALNTLAESIKTYGMINPILVRKKDDKYEIIAGERRFRAATKIGLTEVPVIIKNADEQQMAELALIENIQRQGLSPIEEAKSYEEIMRIGNQTQKSLAEKIGKSQSSIANKIRLLSLPQEIQDALANKKISERHARSLIAVENPEKQIELLNKIITERLTVKETDQIINEKEINADEIKQALSDIMKSLNIKEEEKEDDNMNNGNFFPNFDNNNVANNSASLNMMNMQSMNQAPVTPEPEMVMPTMAPAMPPIAPAPSQEPQLVVPTQPVDPLPTMNVAPEIPVMAPPVVDQFGAAPVNVPNLNTTNNLDPMSGLAVPQDNLSVPQMEAPMINDAPLFGPELTPLQSPPAMTPPMVDEPLFNQNLTVPTQEPAMVAAVPEVATAEPQIIVPEISAPTPTPFEVPVVNQPTLEMPVISDKLTQLQELLKNNGYNYKIYSNETDNCVIIELPKN